MAKTWQKYISDERYKELNNTEKQIFAQNYLDKVISKDERFIGLTEQERDTYIQKLNGSFQNTLLPEFPSTELTPAMVPKEPTIPETVGMFRQEIPLEPSEKEAIEKIKRTSPSRKPITLKGIGYGAIEAIKQHKEPLTAIGAEFIPKAVGIGGFAVPVSIGLFTRDLFKEVIEATKHNPERDLEFWGKRYEAQPEGSAGKEQAKKWKDYSEQVVNLRNQALWGDKETRNVALNQLNEISKQRADKVNEKNEYLKVEGKLIRELKKQAKWGEILKKYPEAKTSYVATNMALGLSEIIATRKILQNAGIRKPPTGVIFALNTAFSLSKPVQEKKVSTPEAVGSVIESGVLGEFLSAVNLGKGELFKYLAKRGLPSLLPSAFAGLSTTFGGVYELEKLFGSTDSEALQSAGTITAFQLYGEIGTAKSKIDYIHSNIHNRFIQGKVTDYDKLFRKIVTEKKPAIVYELKKNKARHLLYKISRAEHAKLTPHEQAIADILKNFGGRELFPLYKKGGKIEVGGQVIKKFQERGLWSKLKKYFGAKPFEPEKANDSDIIISYDNQGNTVSAPVKILKAYYSEKGMPTGLLPEPSKPELKPTPEAKLEPTAKEKIEPTTITPEEVKVAPPTEGEGLKIDLENTMDSIVGRLDEESGKFNLSEAKKEITDLEKNKVKLTEGLNEIDKAGMDDFIARAKTEYEKTISKEHKKGTVLYKKIQTERKAREPKVEKVFLPKKLITEENTPYLSYVGLNQTHDTRLKGFRIGNHSLYSPQGVGMDKIWEEIKDDKPELFKEYEDDMTQELLNEIDRIQTGETPLELNKRFEIEEKEKAEREKEWKAEHPEEVAKIEKKKAEEEAKEKKLGKVKEIPAMDLKEGDKFEMYLPKENKFEEVSVKKVDKAKDVITIENDKTHKVSEWDTINLVGEIEKAKRAKITEVKTKAGNQRTFETMAKVEIPKEGIKPKKVSELTELEKRAREKKLKKAQVKLEPKEIENKIKDFHEKSIKRILNYPAKWKLISDDGKIAKFKIFTGDIETFNSEYAYKFKLLKERAKDVIKNLEKGNKIKYESILKVKEGIITKINKGREGQITSVRVKGEHFKIGVNEIIPINKMLYGEIKRKASNLFTYNEKTNYQAEEVKELLNEYNQMVKPLYPETKPVAKKEGEFKKVVTKVPESSTFHIKPNSFLRFYKDIEKGIDPSKADAFDCLITLKEYYDDYIRWYDEFKTKIGKTEKKLYETYKMRAREINTAIKGNNIKQQIIAIDNGISQWHIDYPVVEHLRMSIDDSIEENVPLMKEWENVINLLDKLGKVPREKPKETPKKLESLVKEAGAEYKNIANGLVYFNITEGYAKGTTSTIKVKNATVENIKKHIAEKQEQFKPVKIPKELEPYKKLYRSGKIKDIRKTGIFLTDSKKIAEQYKDTGLGGKEVKEYFIPSNLKLKEAKTREELVKELYPDMDLVKTQDRLIMEGKRRGGYTGTINGVTAEQRLQALIEKKIKTKLQKQGFDGVKYRGGKLSDQAGEYQIFDANKIKTKSQLTDFYNQAVKEIEQPKPVETKIPKELKLLKEEARKYDKFDKFMTNIRHKHPEMVKINQTIDKEKLKLFIFANTPLGKIEESIPIKIIRKRATWSGLIERTKSGKLNTTIVEKFRTFWQQTQKEKPTEITNYDKLSGLGKQVYRLGILSKTGGKFINNLKTKKISLEKAKAEVETKSLGTWQSKIKKIELAKSRKIEEEKQRIEAKKRKGTEVTEEILGTGKRYSPSEAHDVIARHNAQLRKGQIPALSNEEAESILINAYRKAHKIPTTYEFVKDINKIYYNRKTGRSSLSLQERKKKYKGYFKPEISSEIPKEGDKISIDRAFVIENTQGKKIKIAKGEEYMIYPHPTDEAKSIMQDGNKVTVWEGELKDITNNITILKEGMIKAGGKIHKYRFRSNRLEDYKNRLKEVQKLLPIPQKDIIPFEDFEKFRKDGKITHETPRENLDKILKEGIKEPFGYLGYKTKAEFVTKDAVILHIQIPEYAREGLSFGMRADEINANVDIKKEWIVRAIDTNTGKVLFGKEIPKENMLALSQRVKSVLRPPSKKIAVSFGLLGNKRTSVPLFSSLFKHWVQTGTKIIVEPYGGAFTIGTHSIENSFGYGLKEFHSNIYDKEKYIIIKAIQEGKYRSIKDKIKEAVDNLNQTILDEGQDKEYVNKVFTKFMKRHPNSFIGSKKWIDFVSRIPAGSEVINFDYIYGLFQRTFQDAINKFYPKETTDLDSAIKVALIERIGRFAGGGQSFIASSSGVNTGFKEVESNIFGKFGLIEGFKKANDIFQSADRYKIKISLYNEDGTEFLNKFKNREQTDIGYYLDPPYIGSETTYKGKEVKEELGKFGSAEAYYESHKMIFDFQKEGAKIALNNSQNKSYMKKMLEAISDSRAWIYREGRTSTSLIVSPESIETVDKYFIKEKTEKTKLVPYNFTSATEKGVNIYSDFFEVPEVSKKIKANYGLSEEEIQERKNIIKAIWTVARAKGFSNAKIYRIVKERTNFGTMTHRKMTPELLSKVLKSVKRIRPPTIDHKTVIKLKTEKRIKELKNRFIKEGYITEESYQKILKSMKIREPFYVGKNQFITNKQGIELIRIMFGKTPTIRELYGEKILDIPHRLIRDWRDYKLTDPQLIMDSKQKIFKRKIKEKEKLLTRVLRNFSSVERYAEIIQRRTGENVYDLSENLSKHQGYFELALEREMRELPKEYLVLNTKERELITHWFAGEDTKLSNRALKVAKIMQESTERRKPLLKVNRFQQWLENPARISIKGVPEKRLNELKTIWKEEGNLALIGEIQKTKGFTIEKNYKPDISLSNSFPLYSAPGVGKGLLQSKLGKGIEAEKDALVAFERKLRSDYKILYLNDAIKEMAELLYKENLPNHIKEDIRTLLVNYSIGLQQNPLTKTLEWGISQIIKTALSTPLKWARNFPQRSMILPYTPPHLMPKMFFQVMQRSLLRGSIRITKGKTWKKTSERKKNSFLAHTAEEGALEHEFMGMKRHKILVKLGFLGKLCKKYITVYGGVDSSNRWSIFDPVSINIMRAFEKGKSFRQMKGVLYWAHIPPELKNILRAEIDNKNYEYVALRIAEHMATTKTQWRYGRHEKSIHEQTSGGHLLLRVTTYGRSTIHAYIDDAKTCGEGIINKDVGKFYKGFQAVMLRTALMYAIAKAFIIVFGKKKKYGYGWNPAEVLDVEAAGLVGAVTDLMGGVKDPMFMMTKQLLNRYILGTITDEELKKTVKTESKKLLAGTDTIPYRTIVGYRQVLWMLEAVYGVKKIKLLSDAYNKIIDDKGWDEKEIERNAWEIMRHAIVGTDTEEKKQKGSSYIPISKIGGG